MVALQNFIFKSIAKIPYMVAQENNNLNNLVNISYHSELINNKIHYLNNIYFLKKEHILFIGGGYLNPSKTVA